MVIEVYLQSASKQMDIPKLDFFRHWIALALDGQFEKDTKAEITVRVVDSPEMQHLNLTYRHQNKPTNVLAFPFDPLPNGILEGDLAICAPIVIEEAEVQNKDVTAHWAHLTVHGTLHLLGYNHVDPSDASVMENLEVQILQKLGFGNPYN